MRGGQNVETASGKQSNTRVQGLWVYGLGLIGLGFGVQRASPYQNTWWLALDF